MLADGMRRTDDSARKMSNQLSETFIAFARASNPDNATIPTRETYDLPRRATVAFNNPSKLVHDPRGAERRLFAKVPFIQQGT
jgi:para-nitrobenzyl esterase